MCAQRRRKVFPLSLTGDRRSRCSGPKGEERNKIHERMAKSLE